MMATICRLMLAVLIVQAYVDAAPNKNSTQEDKSNKASETPPIALLDVNDNNDTKFGQRHKRYYNRDEYSYYPWSRKTYFDFGPEPLNEIKRLLENINADLRQQNTQPPIPFYYPVFYVPQRTLICLPRKPYVPPQVPTSTEPSMEPSTEPPMEPSAEPSTSNGSDTSTPPNISNRDLFPDTRPISFDPITPKTPLKRPPLPVDHGTVQNGNNNTPPVSSSIPTTTQSPTESPNTTPEDKRTTITICDNALVICCHQAVIPINECFASQGCSNRTPTRNPCDTSLLYEVTKKFIKYYTAKKG